MEPQPKIMAVSKKTYKPRTLVSYCLSTIKTEFFNRLQQEVSTQFPLCDNNAQLSSAMALTKLMAITNISYENDCIRLTPISIELKKVPIDDVLNNTCRTDLITSLLPYLKTHSSTIQHCVLTIAKDFYYRDMEKHDFLRPVPKVLQQFLYAEIQAYTEYRKYEDEIVYYCFPSSQRFCHP